MLIARSISRLSCHLIFLLFGCLIATEFRRPRDHLPQLKSLNRPPKCCLASMCYLKRDTNKITCKKKLFRANGFNICENENTTIAFLCVEFYQTQPLSRSDKKFLLLPFHLNIDSHNKVPRKENLKLLLLNEIFPNIVPLLSIGSGCGEKETCNFLVESVEFKPSCSENMNIVSENTSFLNILYLLHISKYFMLHFENFSGCLCAQVSHSQPESFRIYKYSSENVTTSSYIPVEESTLNVFQRLKYLRHHLPENSSESRKALGNRKSKSPKIMEIRRVTKKLSNYFKCLQRRGLKNSSHKETVQHCQNFIFTSNIPQIENVSDITRNRYYHNRNSDVPKAHSFLSYIAKKERISSRKKRQSVSKPSDKAYKNVELKTATNFDRYSSVSLSNENTPSTIISGTQKRDFRLFTQPILSEHSKLNGEGATGAYIYQKIPNYLPTDSWNYQIGSNSETDSEKRDQNVDLKRTFSSLNLKSEISTEALSPDASLAITTERNGQNKNKLDRGSGLNNNDILITPQIPNLDLQTHDLLSKHTLTSLPNFDSHAETSDAFIPQELDIDLEKFSTANTSPKIGIYDETFETQDDVYGSQDEQDSPVSSGFIPDFGDTIATGADLRFREPTASTVSDIFTKVGPKKNTVTDYAAGLEDNGISTEDSVLSSSSFSIDYTLQRIQNNLRGSGRLKDEITSFESIRDIFTQPEDDKDSLLQESTVTKTSLPKSSEDSLSYTAIGGRAEENEIKDETYSFTSKFDDNSINENTEPKKQIDFSFFVSRLITVRNADDSNDKEITDTVLASDYDSSFVGGSAVSNEGSGVTTPYIPDSNSYDDDLYLSGFPSGKTEEQGSAIKIDAADFISQNVSEVNIPDLTPSELENSFSKNNKLTPASNTESEKRNSVGSKRYYDFPAASTNSESRKTPTEESIPVTKIVAFDENFITSKISSYTLSPGTHIDKGKYSSARSISTKNDELPASTADEFSTVVDGYTPDFVERDLKTESTKRTTYSMQLLPFDGRTAEFTVTGKAGEPSLNITEEMSFSDKEISSSVEKKIVSVSDAINIFDEEIESSDNQSSPSIKKDILIPVSDVTSIFDKETTSSDEKSSLSIQKDILVPVSDVTRIFDEDEKMTSTAEQSSVRKDILVPVSDVTSILDEHEEITTIDEQSSSTIQEDILVSFSDVTIILNDNEEITTVDEQSSTIQEDILVSFSDVTSILNDNEEITTIDEQFSSTIQKDILVSVSDVTSTLNKDEKVMTINEQSSSTFQEDILVSVSDVTSILNEDEEITTIDEQSSSTIQENILVSNNDVTRTLNEDEEITTIDEQSSSTIQGNILVSDNDVTRTLNEDEEITTIDEQPSSTIQENILVSDNDVTRTLNEDEEITTIDEQPSSTIQEDILISVSDVTSILNDNEEIKTVDEQSSTIQEDILVSDNDVTRTLNEDEEITTVDEQSSSTIQENILVSDNDVTRTLNEDEEITTIDEQPSSTIQEDILISVSDVTSILNDNEEITTVDEQSSTIQEDILVSVNDVISTLNEDEEITTVDEQSSSTIQEDILVSFSDVTSILNDNKEITTIDEQSSSTIQEDILVSFSDITSILNDNEEITTVDEQSSTIQEDILVSVSDVTSILNDNEEITTIDEQFSSTIQKDILVSVSDVTSTLNEDEKVMTIDEQSSSTIQEDILVSVSNVTSILNDNEEFTTIDEQFSSIIQKDILVSVSDVTSILNEDEEITSIDKQSSSTIQEDILVSIRDITSILDVKEEMTSIDEQSSVLNDILLPVTDVASILNEDEKITSIDEQSSSTMQKDILVSIRDVSSTLNKDKEITYIDELSSSTIQEDILFLFNDVSSILDEDEEISPSDEQSSPSNEKDILIPVSDVATILDEETVFSNEQTSTWIEKNIFVPVSGDINNLVDNILSSSLAVPSIEISSISTDKVTSFNSDRELTEINVEGITIDESLESTEISVEDNIFFSSERKSEDEISDFSTISDKNENTKLVPSSHPPIVAESTETLQILEYLTEKMLVSTDREITSSDQHTKNNDIVSITEFSLNSGKDSSISKTPSVQNDDVDDTPEDKILVNTKEVSSSETEHSIMEEYPLSTGNDSKSFSSDNDINTDDVLIRTDRDVFSQNSVDQPSEENDLASENSMFDEEDETTDQLKEIIRTEREIPTMNDRTSRRRGPSSSIDTNDSSDLQLTGDTDVQESSLEPTLKSVYSGDAEGTQSSDLENTEFINENTVSEDISKPTAGSIFPQKTDNIVPITMQYTEIRNRGTLPEDTLEPKGSSAIPESRSVRSLTEMPDLPSDDEFSTEFRFDASLPNAPPDENSSVDNIDPITLQDTEIRSESTGPEAILEPTVGTVFPQSTDSIDPPTMQDTEISSEDTLSETILKPTAKSSFSQSTDNIIPITFQYTEIRNEATVPVDILEPTTGSIFPQRTDNIDPRNFLDTEINSETTVPEDILEASTRSSFPQTTDNIVPITLQYTEIRNEGTVPGDVLEPTTGSVFPQSTNMIDPLTLQTSSENTVSKNTLEPKISSAVPESTNVGYPTETSDLPLNGELSTEFLLNTSLRTPPPDENSSVEVDEESSTSTANTENISTEPKLEFVSSSSTATNDLYPGSSDSFTSEFTATEKNRENTEEIPLTFKSTTILAYVTNEIYSSAVAQQTTESFTLGKQSIQSFDEENQSTESLDVETPGVYHANAVTVGAESSTTQTDDSISKTTPKIEEENTSTAVSLPLKTTRAKVPQVSKKVSTATRTMGESTVSPTEGSIIPFHFTIDADYDEIVGNRKKEFEENLAKQLVRAMRVPVNCLQNLRVKKGSIEVNFDLVPSTEHGHLADERALKAAAEELKRMIDNGQLTINDLDGNTLIVIPMDPPTTPPPVTQSERTTLILGVVIGAFILTVISVVVTAIIVKRKANGGQRLTPIEEVRSKLPAYPEIPFQEALFTKGSQNKLILGKYCYDTGQWLGPGPEPVQYHPPNSVVYTPPTDTEIRRTPRPSTAVRERLKNEWELDWDSMVFSR